jgi:hypothetical protein
MSERREKYGYAHLKPSQPHIHSHICRVPIAVAMNLAQLQPANTQKANALAQNVFSVSFLNDQNVQMEDVATAVQGDPTGSILVSLLDRFGVHLAFQEGKKGEKLAHTTVMQYFRQAKLWLLVTTLSWSFEMRDGKQESRSMGLAECIEANRRLKEKEAVILTLGYAAVRVSVT